MQIERSKYYTMSICERLEQPKNYIFSPDRRGATAAEVVASIVKGLLLGIPAAIGYGLSKAIYCLAGEEIRDYDAQLNAWERLIKTADTNNSAYTVGSVALLAIDEFIRNRIQASERLEPDTINSLRAQCIKCTWS